MLPNPIFVFFTLCILGTVCFVTWHACWMLIQVFGG